MARTIMISNELYKELKKIKKENSFTETIKDLLDRSKEVKTGKDLFPLIGALKNDKEYDEIMKEVKKGWAAWTRKYA